MKPSFAQKISFFILFLAADVLCPASLTAQTRQWVTQIGSPVADVAADIALYNNYVYVAGGTDGSLITPSQGGRDAFLIQYDSGGGQLWSLQIGTASDDTATGVAVDRSGNIYLVGTTIGTLVAGRSYGATDLWLAKYDSNGRQVWITQLGTASDDFATGIAIDLSGNVFIGGNTAGGLGRPNLGGDDAWVAGFDANGNQLWVRQLGTPDRDNCYGIATDNFGHVYLAGTTAGALAGNNLGGSDAFLAQLDTGGNLLWTRQFGTSNTDIAKDVAVDAAGYILLAGHTLGALSGGGNAGGFDAFLARYDVSGTRTWLRQIGTTGDDLADTVAVDNMSQVYLAGETTGSLGDVNQGLTDIWFARYDSQGTRVWLTQSGTINQETANAVAVDASCNVYLAGNTQGNLGSTNSGGDDAYVLQYSQLPTLLSFTPNTGTSGTSVVIRGANYYGVTSVTFNDTPATFTVDSPIQLTATLPAAASTGRVRVTTSCGIATSTTDFTNTTPPTVTLNATPTSRTLIAGQTTTYDVNIARTNYPGSVTLSVSGQPSGATTAFSINPTTGNLGRLTIGTPLNTNGATYNLTIRATATGITIAPIIVTLTVNPVRVTLTATPTSRSIYVGQSATYTINIIRTNYTGPVDLNGFFNWPNGIQVAFNPARANGNNSTLTLTPSPITRLGTFTLNVAGSVPGLTIAPISVSLTVNPSPVNLVAGNPTVTIRPCEPAAFDILINRTNYAGAVDLSVSGLPLNATASFSSDPTTGNSSILTVTTQCGTPPGASTLTLSATAPPGFTILSIPVTLNINSNPAYSDLGSNFSDYAQAIATDASGNVYVAGTTSSDFDGSGTGSLAGLSDGWVAKYSSTGVLQWVKQLGSPDYDTATAVAVDATGNVYVAGNTHADMDGSGPATSSGGCDVWVAKFNNSGTLQWITQDGEQDRGYYPTEIAVDGGGNIYVAGKLAEGTIDGDGSFVARVANTGAFAWNHVTRPRPEAHHVITALAADSAGNVYYTNVAWSLRQEFSAYSGFSKDDSSGASLHFEYSETDTFWGVALDSTGNIYLTGSSFTDFGPNGPLTLTASNAWLQKYDSNFNYVWSRRFGSPVSDDSYRIRIDASDNIYLLGSTDGDMDGAGPGSSGHEGWIARFTTAGQMRWLRQGGGIEPSARFTPDGFGSIYFAFYFRPYGRIVKFSEDVLPYISSFTPTTGPVGTTITISGNHFTGTTDVNFNGVPAVFTVSSPTQITVTVPAGVSIGKIMIVTRCGVAFSTTDFVP